MNTPDSPNSPAAPRQEPPQDGWRDICWSSARQIAAMYPVPSGQYEDRLQELAMIVSMAISRSKQLDAPTPAAPVEAQGGELAKQLMDCAEYAWTIIANAGGGNWGLESKDWQTAAAKWRDENYYPLLKFRAALSTVAAAPKEDGHDHKLAHRIACHLLNESDVNNVEKWQEAQLLAGKIYQVLCPASPTTEGRT